MMKSIRGSAIAAGTCSLLAPTRIVPTFSGYISRISFRFSVVVTSASVCLYAPSCAWKISSITAFTIGIKNENCDRVSGGGTGDGLRFFDGHFLGKGKNKGIAQNAQKLIDKTEQKA